MSTLSRVVIYVLAFVLITANIYVGQYGLAVLVMSLMLLVEIVPVFADAKQEPLDYKKLAEAFKTTSTIATVKPNKDEAKPEPEPIKKPTDVSKTIDTISALAKNDKVKALGAAAAGFAISKLQEEGEEDSEEESEEDSEEDKEE